MAAVTRLGPALGLVLVWLLFAGLIGSDFTKWETQRLILIQTTIVGIAAVGATLIIVSGGLDLSVGSTIALSTVVIALLLKAGADPLIAALGGVATGLAVGWMIGTAVVGHVSRVAALPAAAAAFWLMVWWAERVDPTQRWAIFPYPLNLFVAAATFALVFGIGGWLIRKTPLSPFIVTLGMWGALRGLAKGIAENQPVYPPHPTWLHDLMATRGGEGIWALPPGVWLLLIVALAGAALLRLTVLGRHLYAVGSNEATARLCGIKVDRVRLLAYVLGVGCAGLAGVLEFSYLTMGDPTTASGTELKVIAAVVIGGASLAGGEGGVFGTLVGALLMTVVDSGCTRLGLDNWVQEIVTGAIILGAVVLDRVRARSRGD